MPILKPDGKVRICGNYAVTVNQIAKGDAYPIPNINELYNNKLSGGVIYSKLDLSHAYQQLVLDDESRKYTTINTSKGLFEYTRLPFGINAAPGIFQRTMENLLSQIPMTTVYLDDILIAGKTVEEHDKHLKMVLDKLQQHGMTLKKSKCMLMKTSIEYLGHKLDADGIHLTGKKFEGVQNAVPPKNVSELRSFLGLINYYHKFLNNLSTILAHLYELLKENVKWNWAEPRQTAFGKCKEMLKSSTLLVHYNPDLPLVLNCDASPVGIACIMSHVIPDNTERPIMYASRTLQTAEKNYSQLEREALAIVYGIKYFHKYLAGRKFTVVTDHKPLLGIFILDKPIPNVCSTRLQKWILAIGGYDYKLKYKMGKLNENADALSRLPQPTTPCSTT